MAKYRQIHIEFWQDGFVLDLTPEEKYFYIYLMTNSKTSQCGIYELPKRIIETETGYNRETVEKLLKRFEEYGKIMYNELTREIMILNWIKYNWINSVKVFSLISKELKNVKNKHFVKLFIRNCKEYGYRIDTLSIDLGEEREEEREREEEKEQQEEDVKEIMQFWDDNGFGLNNVFGKQKLLSWLDDSSFKEKKLIILRALEIAAGNNKRTLSYVEGILRNWDNRNLLTLSEIEQESNPKQKASGFEENYDPNKDLF
ncbi:DnaD domain-containing protein [Gracilibacillus saliphilus]|uniref:DnaD domain-containing protein n=1 Tax=Gracilibacillus saliphilus TaxID=543890 RepID=UPI0013D598CC|nr:DnaD domain protein [Gracilibacillus saliphilus]